MSNESQARERAEQFRANHGLGVAPIKDVFEAVHSTLGIDVISMDAGEEEHGLTMKDPVTDRVVIAVATTPHPMRLRSSVAHEMGHVLAGDLDADVELSPGERSDAEIQADAFARHVLVPLEAVRQRFSSGVYITLHHLSTLVQEYGVSPQVAAIQLREASLITGGVCAEWGRHSTVSLASRFGWWSQYLAMADDSRRPRAPQSLMARAVEGYLQGLIDVRELAHWYGQDPAVVAEGLGEPVGVGDDEDWGLNAPLFPAARSGARE